MKRILLLFFILISIKSKAQLEVGSYIYPANNSPYATHIDTFGRGGYMCVADTIARDGILSVKRKYGMAVFVKSTNKLYVLKDTLLQNNWTEFTTSSTSSIDSIRRKIASDSVFGYIKGAPVFQFRDSIGGGSSNSIDSIRRKVASDSVFGYIKGVSVFQFRDSIGKSSNSIDSIRRKVASDSVFGYINNVKVFQFKDSIGGGSSNSIDSIRRKVASDSVFGYIKGVSVFQFRDSIGSGTTIDTTSLSNRINQKLNISDTGSMLLQYVNFSDTTAMLTGKALKSIVISATMTGATSTITGGGNLTANRTLTIPRASASSDGYLNRTDFSLFQNKQSAISANAPLNLNGSSGILTIYKANATDSGYLSSADWNIFNNKLNPSDTTSLSNRINLKLNASDTASLSNRINSKLNPSDTISLSNRINLKLNPSDTASLSNRINLKVNISDTAGMLNPYLKKNDTTNKFVNRITRNPGTDSIIFFIGSNRYAIKDSVGGSGTITRAVDTIYRTLGKDSIIFTINGTRKAIKDSVANSSGINGAIQFKNGTGFLGDSSLFWDNTNKRLGIGTINPARTLDVTGNVTFRTIPYGNADYVLGYNTADGSINYIPKTTGGSSGNFGTIQLSNDDGGFISKGIFVFDTATNSLGIGTSTPQVPLDIGGGSGVRFLLYGTGGNPQYLAGLGVNLGQASNSMGFFTGANSPFSIDQANTLENFPYTSGYTTRFVVAPGGNVGIGTVSPAATLDVNASNSGNPVAQFQSGSGYPIQILTVDEGLTGNYSAPPGSIGNQSGQLYENQDGDLKWRKMTRPYRSYVAQLSQSGTNAPIANILENDLGYTPTWSRTGVGNYILSSTELNAENADKVVVFLTIGTCCQTPMEIGYSAHATWDRDSKLISIITAYNNGSSEGTGNSDDLLSDGAADDLWRASIEVRIYD